jgi:hypothetical protein
MSDAPWQHEVADLLEQMVQALRDKNDRRAIRAFGTAVAYLELAREQGDRLAAELLSQVTPKAKEDPTERFTFQPGELEALSVRDEPPIEVVDETTDERIRKAKKKKRR